MYYLKKLVCKNWYQLADNYGSNKHLDVNTLINATCSKSKNKWIISKMTHFCAVHP